MEYSLVTVEAHTRFSDGVLKVMGVHTRTVSEPVPFNVEDVSEGLTIGGEEVAGHAFFIRFTVPRTEDWECFQSSSFREAARENKLDPVELYDLCVDAWVLSLNEFVSFNAYTADTRGPASLLIRRPWRQNTSASE